MKLNNTIKAETDIIFFNRVPKVGSQTLMDLLRILGEENNFVHGRDQLQKFEVIVMNQRQQIDLINNIFEAGTPSVYSKHVAYVDFNQFSYPKPIYINLVRDPVERLISWFYYIRTPWYFVDLKLRFPDYALPSVEFLRKDFETCIRTGDKICLYEPGSMLDGGDHRRQILFFCGHNRTDCMPFNSFRAMQIAKNNVEKDYAVVGSLDDLNITLTVLENYIPKFFHSATELYYRSKKRLDNMNRNLYKPEISEEIKNMLRKNLTHEIEFYQFCKQRLYTQYISLAIDNIIPNSNLFN